MQRASARSTDTRTTPPTRRGSRRVINNGRGTLTDEACEKAIAEKMGKRRVSDVLLIRSDGTCWRKRKYKEPRRDHKGPIKAPFNASLLNQSYTETGI